MLKVFGSEIFDKVLAKLAKKMEGKVKKVRISTCYARKLKNGEAVNATVHIADLLRSDL